MNVLFKKTTDNCMAQGEQHVVSLWLGSPGRAVELGRAVNKANRERGRAPAG